MCRLRNWNLNMTQGKRTWIHVRRDFHSLLVLIVLLLSKPDDVQNLKGLYLHLSMHAWRRASWPIAIGRLTSYRKIVI